MHTVRLLPLASLVLLASLLTASRPAHAAETYHSCVGFIDSLPTVITTQGVWCLREDIGTAITSGKAITIDANNVTIDCNSFKVGGLGAGNGSNAIGIYTSGQQNVTIRNCNIRGFQYGISLTGGGAGHLVEDNLLDNNLYIAIRVTGDNSLVRRNRIYDTGGLSGYKWAYGILADTDVVDNTVSGLFADVSGGFLKGIDVGVDSALITGNKISGFDMTAVQGGAVDHVTGIFASGQHTRISGNQIAGSNENDPAITGNGIFVNGTVYASAYCTDNTIGGFTNNILQCDVSNGNLTLP